MDLAPALAIPARGRATCEEEECLTFAVATDGCSVAFDDGASARLLTWSPTATTLPRRIGVAYAHPKASDGSRRGALHCATTGLLAILSTRIVENIGRVNAQFQIEDDLRDAN
jgi:hypothetical protein